MKEVIIAEKPSLAKSIAEGLGCKTKKNGYYTNNNGLYVTNVFGHMMELKKPEFMNKAWGGAWNITKLPMIPNFNLTKDYVIKEDSKNQFDIIQKLVEDADVLYNAGDPDREGELLILELYANLKLKKDVKKYRLWLLDTNKKYVQDEFSAKKPQEDFFNVFYSAWTRSKADWLVGFNLTPLYTIKGQEKYGYETGLWSIGRCQTSIIDILVKREEKITNFIPETFYEFFSKYNIKGFEGQWFEEIQDEEDGKTKQNVRIFGKEKYEGIKQKLIGQKQGKVIKIASGIKKEYNNGLYSKNDLLSDAGKKLGYDLKQVSPIVDELYEKYKILSYPRTDNNFINDTDFPKIKAVLGEFEKMNNEFSSEISFLKENNLIQPNSSFVNNDKVGAHTGLFPVIPDRGFANVYNSLPPKHREVLNLIITKILANMYPPYMYESSLIYIDINGETFKSNGNILKDEGWKVLYKKYGSKKNKDVVLPDMKEGDVVEIKEINDTERQTEPPKRYSETNLISYISNLNNIVKNDPDIDEELKKRILEINQKQGKDRTLGIGTSSTTANIFETLYQRKYIEKKGKTIIPTEKGIKLINMIDNQIVNPVTTALWEDKLKSIEEGEGDHKKFIEDLLVEINRVLDAEIPKLKNTGTGNSNIQSEKTDETCSKCGTGLIIKTITKNGNTFKIKECPNYTLIKPTKKGGKWKKDGCDFSEFLNNSISNSIKKPKGKETNEECSKCGTKLVIKEITSKKNNKKYKIKECPNYKLSKKGSKWIKDGCDFSEFI